MKISSTLPYFGCKRNLAAAIVEQLGPHRCYWEPFCGSCAVLFSKPKGTYETVNDLHRDLINLTLCLQDEAKAYQLYARTSQLLFHEELLPMARAMLTERKLEPGEIDVNRAYWYLVFSWMGLNGISGIPINHAGTFAVRYSANGGNGATRWQSVCESIPDWHRRLVGVQILSRDAFELLGRIQDEKGTAIYADPPYITKGAKYVHDFQEDDHRRLAELLHRFRKCRVVVSYYSHPLLRELYSDWTVIPVKTAKALVNSGKREKGRVEAPEVLLVNGAEYFDGGEMGTLFPE